VPLGTSQIGVGVKQSVFDMQLLGLPLLLELEEEVPSPPVPPVPELDEELDELTPLAEVSGKSMMSVHPPASSIIAAEIPTSPPIQTLPNLCMLTASKRKSAARTISGVRRYQNRQRPSRSSEVRDFWTRALAVHGFSKTIYESFDIAFRHRTKTHA
jgi:hypothetical protein